MSVDFRQRSPGEILQILYRRKWLIVLPAITVFLAVAWVVRGLPEVFESTTLLTITPPKISEKVAPSLTDDDVSQRLQAISQMVLSRSSLEPMIVKYGLYERERASGMSMEAIVDRMKGKIKLDPEKADENRIVGFRISFRAPSPIVAQQATAELGQKYVTAQTVESKQSAENTKEFIDSQISQSRATLDGLDKQRLDIMSRNIDTLPESAQGLIAQLQGLRQREQSISKEKETLINERGRIQETIRSINSQMNLVETFGEKETQDAVNQASRVEDTPAYGEMLKRRVDLVSKLENLKKQYREKHPDIVQAQTEIKTVDAEIEKLKKSTEQRIKAVNQSSSRKTELQKRSLEIEREKSEGHYAQVGQQILNKDEELKQNLVQIGGLEAKINTIPSVKVALEGLNNQYASAKAGYEDLLKKYSNAQQQVERETNEQGEAIRVVDPASLPQSPVNASKRPMFMGIGLAAGLVLGLLLAAVYEVPRLFKLQTAHDVEHYTGMNVLVSVPPLLSEGETARLNRIGRAKVLAGMVGSLLSIPVVIVVLQATQLLERLN